MKLFPRLNILNSHHFRGKLLISFLLFFTSYSLFALTLRQDIDQIKTIDSCNCYGETFTEADCEGLSPNSMAMLSCDGKGQIINPYAVINHMGRTSGTVNIGLSNRCGQFLLSRAQAQNSQVLSDYLKSGVSSAIRNHIELGGVLYSVYRNRLSSGSIISVSDSNTCGFSEGVIRASRDISAIVFSESMTFGLEAITPAVEDLTLSDRIERARSGRRSASHIENLERQRDRIINEEAEGAHEREFCNALDGCKLAGGTRQNINGQSFCIVGGIALDNSCLNLAPSVRAKLIRNVSGAKDRGVACLRGYSGSAVTAGDALQNHFDTPVNNLPRTHLCCGNSGCAQTTFDPNAHRPSFVRSIGGVTYGRNSPNGTIILSNSTLTSSYNNADGTQGIIFHEFLHRLGGSTSCLHNHQDRTNHMRPNAQGQCYPQDGGFSSSITFINQNGQCVPDPASPNAACARLMTSVQVDQYDPVYACQTSCFQPRPTEAGAQRRWDNSRDLCQGFIGGNSMASTSDSMSVSGIIRNPDGTERTMNACQFLTERNGSP